MANGEAKVRTVLGDVPADGLGVTLAHEHIFLDLRNQFIEPEGPAERERSRLDVNESHAGLLGQNPYALSDNLVLDDADVASAELMRFKALGGRSVVDCTPGTLGRSPEGLRRLAQATGLNIITGCGYYTADTHPEDLAERAVEDLAEEIVLELSEGIDGSGIAAGVIGEVGTGAELHPGEHKSLVAAGLAHREIPVAIHVHTFPWARIAVDVADVLIETGVDPAKVVIDHLDVDIDEPHVVSILERGVVAGFDCFGKEYQLGASDGAFAPGPFATDAQRVDLIVQLLDKGYGRQLTISTDICFKTLLSHYGGKGYAHILENVVPMLRERGVDDTTINTILIQNPARLYAI